MFRRGLLGLILLFAACDSYGDVTGEVAKQKYDASAPKKDITAQKMEMYALRLKAANESLGARVDTATVPPPPKRGGYRIGQRVVYTVWLDNDDPSDGMRNVAIWISRLPDYMRLDLSAGQPAYGNIFYDSGVPSYPDTPAVCRAYYISKPEGDTRGLSLGTDPDSVQDVVWVATRGNGEQVVWPHNANDDIYQGDTANTSYGVRVDSDQMFVRYSAIVVGKPGKVKKKK